MRDKYVCSSLERRAEVNLPVTNLQIIKKLVPATIIPTINIHWTDGSVIKSELAVKPPVETALKDINRESKKLIFPTDKRRVTTAIETRCIKAMV